MTTGSTKKCWSCDATTPYKQGWCRECEEATPESVHLIALLAAPEGRTPEPYAGAIRQAIANTLRQERRPKTVYQRVFTQEKKIGKLSIEDLGI